MTQKIEALRNRFDKMHKDLKDIFIAFPDHKDREHTEEEFMNRSCLIVEHLNWMIDRLTEKSIYSEARNSDRAGKLINF